MGTQGVSIRTLYRGLLRKQKRKIRTKESAVKATIKATGRDVYGDT